MKVVVSTSSPTDIINYLKKKKVAGLYFIDIDLDCEINGIDLAEEIRQHDRRGFIVFITSDTGAHFLTLKRKVEMLDYITKDSENLEDEIRACVKLASERGLPEISTPLQSKISIKISSSMNLAIKPSDILFFKTAQPHFLSVNYIEDNGVQSRTFRGKLTDVMRNLDERFFRCARDYIVNTDKIVGIDKKDYKLILENDIRIGITASSIKILKERMSIKIQ